MSGTPMLHQVRDQALHMAYGAVAGALVAGWWQALAIAGIYAAIREGEQWGTLNTPSVKDSAIDWSFVMLGCAAAIGIRLAIHG